MVSFLRPWVGEVDVEAFNGAVRYGFGEELRGIGPDYSHVCDCPSADAVDGIAVVFSRTFDAEEVDVRVGFCLVQEEGSLTGADLDVDWRGTSENAGEVDFSIEISGP